MYFGVCESVSCICSIKEREREREEHDQINAVHHHYHHDYLVLIVSSRREERKTLFTRLREKKTTQDPRFQVIIDDLSILTDKAVLLTCHMYMSCLRHEVTLPCIQRPFIDVTVMMMTEMQVVQDRQEFLLSFLVVECFQSFLRVHHILNM